MSNWADERDKKRAERQQRQLQRALAAPPARGEVFSSMSVLEQHVASVAIAIEALENRLVVAGVLKPDELMNEIQSLIKAKSESAAAQEAAQGEGKVVIVS